MESADPSTSLGMTVLVIPSERSESRDLYSSTSCRSLDGVDARSAPKTPERTAQPRLGEQRFGFVDGGWSPGGLRLVAVPAVREPPRLIERDHGAAAHVPRGAPAVDVLFIPEEQCRASREADVVPPPRRRHGEVHYSLGARQCAVADLEP